MEKSYLKDLKGMEYVKALRYNIAIETDITSIIITDGLIDHAIGGPGLTCDILKLKNKQAADGRIYFFYTTEPDRAVKYYDELYAATAHPSTFKHFYVCDDGKYAVAIIDPTDYGLAKIPINQTRLTNKCCIMKYMNADMTLGTSDGTYIFKPKELDLESFVSIENDNHVVNKFAQIYLKSYLRLGFEIDFTSYMKVWKRIVMNNFRYDDLNDDIKINQWIKGLPNEPITLIH